MQIFEQGDIIRVPFPYTDRDTRQHRPALVVSNGRTGEGDTLLWVVMITSAANRSWVHDVVVPEQAGLAVPSVVRPVKIATIEARHAETIGKLPSDALASVMHCVRGILGTEGH